MTLNPKQARFAAEYLVDMNATKAAERAGYSAKTARAQGSLLLTNPDIQAALRVEMSKQHRRTQLSADRVLSEYMRIAFADVSEAYDEAGNLRPIRDIPEDVRRAISGVDVEERIRGKGEDAEPIQIKKLRFWNKNDALNALGKHLRLFVDLVEAKVEGLDDAKRAERIAEMLATARARKGDG
jgi:phage terminase small subunit